MGLRLGPVYIRFGPFDGTLRNRMRMGAQPIERCPICRYRLRGLPRNHRCPECGYLYTFPCYAFKRNVAAWKWLAWGNLAIFAIGLLFLLFQGSYTFFLVAGIGVAGAGYRVLMDRRQVVVTPEHLEVIVGREIRRRLPLSSIGSCNWSRVDGGIYIVDLNGAELGSIPHSFFWSHRVAKALAEKVNSIVSK